MSDNATSPSTEMVKDQYQHAIPQFILRNFQSNPVQYRTSKERKVARFIALVKDGKELEAVHYYDLNTGMLSLPSICRIYGRVNLYRDAAHSTNVDHLEKKLGHLENSTAAVIRTIHNSIDSRAFQISRSELYTLRKFLFLMHYRHDAMATKYFQEDLPHNAPLAAWMRKYKERHNLSTVTDIWRHGLGYYLDTAHQTILTTGEDIRARYGSDKFHQMLAMGVDPDLEERWFAVDYESQANNYVLGVWEAASGSEFVLGGNAFGLWEGRIHGNPGAHKIYVVSPRIAIVLRHHILLRDGSDDPSVLTSCLSDIEIGQPEIWYNFLDAKFFEMQANGLWTVEERRKYRRSAQAQKDTFTIPITKLSEDETYAVNEIVMMNANMHQDGAITYSSSSRMLKTLQRYMNAQNTFVGLKKGLYRPLLRELLNIDVTSLSSSPNASDLVQPESDADRQLSLLLRMIVVSGGMEFRSQYNRAYLVYHMATMATSLTNPVTRDIRRIVNEAVEKMKPFAEAHPAPPVHSLTYTPTSILPTPPSSPTRTSPNPKPKSKSKTLAGRPPAQPSTPPQPTRMVLVETLSKDDSDLFFARFGAEVDKLEVREYTNDLLSNIIYEAAMIGIAEWMAETRPDILQTSFKPLLKAAEIL